jgi:hypothetical protein
MDVIFMKNVAQKLYKEEDMDSIDVHDLPEEQAELLAAFVAFLRQRRQRAEVSAPEALIRTAEPFATWPLGVKGRLTREDIYEHL